MLSVTIIGNSDDDVKVRQLLGGANQIHRSRIASVISIRIHPETAEYATADYTVQLTFQSLMGISYALLLPDIMKQAKVMDAQTKRGDASFAASVFAIGGNKPENVSTRNDNFRAIIRGQDRMDKQGPYITQYLHRFTLVKEQGQWRISNAVTVSDSAPVPSP